MKHKILFSILILCFIFPANSQTIIGKKEKENVDSIKIKESFKQKDIPINDYLKKELKPIRENFKKLNSIENWTKIKIIYLQKSTEGGQAKFYFQGDKLQKIITRDFGETSQKITEYYLLKNKLSFVFEKLYKYNRPIYYDSKAKKENNDTEKFDFDKSEIIEDRSYFNNGILLRQINNQDCGSPFAKDYLLKEQRRLLQKFNQLKNLQTKK